MKSFIALVEYLNQNKVPHVSRERIASKSNFFIIANGLKIICSDNGYDIRTIMHNNPVPGVALTPEDCYQIITKGIFSDSPYMSIFKYFHNKDTSYLQNIPKYLRMRMNSRRIKLIEVEKMYKKGDITIDEAIEKYEKIIVKETKKPLKKHRDVAEILKSGLVPYIGEVSIEVPIVKNQELNGKITLENLIIFDILTTYPYLINHVLRWNKTGYTYLNIQKNLTQEFDHLKRTKVKGLPISWVSIIKESEWRELIWNNLTDWVSVKGRHEDIKTSNPSVWQQFLIAMRIIRYDSLKHHVPISFLEKLPLINIYVLK